MKLKYLGQSVNYKKPKKKAKPQSVVDFLIFIYIYFKYTNKIK